MQRDNGKQNERVTEGRVIPKTEVSVALKID